MARMPGANWLGEHSPGKTMTAYDVVCIHTIVGSAPAHAAHFSTHDTGRIDQSRDTKFRSAANLDGNHRVIAIENEDGARDVPLTDAQITACAKILAWAHKTHGVPLQLCPNSKPGSRGLAYHRQGIDGNFGGYDYPGRVSGGEHWSEVYGKTCPRDKRIAQLPEILRRAKMIVNPPPPPAPVTTHTRWAIRTTGVHATPGGTKLRDLAAGDRFSVIDGSGHGTDGWIQTTHGNWVLGADTTTTIFSTFLWNVKTGRSWANAILPALNEMLAAEQPDTAGLLEAYDAPDLRGLVPGYSYVYQALGYEPATPGYVEEHSGCVVLVRDGLEVKAREAIEMTTSWKGPVVGAWHDPRIIRRVTVEKNGVDCRPIYGHGPFGKDAVAEFDAEMVREIKELGALGPVMALADWNQDNATVTAKVGTPAGAKVDGGGIDLAVYKSCTKIKGKNLGPHGSDHDAKVWTFGV